MTIIGSVVDTVHMYLLCSVVWYTAVIGKRNLLSMP